MARLIYAARLGCALRNMTRLCGMTYMCDMTHMCDITHVYDLTCRCAVTHSYTDRGVWGADGCPHFNRHGAPCTATGTYMHICIHVYIYLCIYVH